ncbi:MAG: hypothetical protein JST50_10270 [Bacteroidetes bacterium]|nr:hypothetical protein [Bacteroidota bacterium]
MKNQRVFFAGLFLLLFSFLGAGAQATSGPDYFVGKWSVTAAGTPNGDAKFIVNLQRTDGKLDGTIETAEPGKAPTKIDKVEEKDNSITVYFVGGGYDVYLNLQKKDDDHVAGSLMDMFDAKGERMKDANAKP